MAKEGFNNVQQARILSGLTPTFLSRLLYMTVHAYENIEKGRIPASFVERSLLSAIYDIKEEDLFSHKGLTDRQKQALVKIASLSEEERESFITKRLLGGGAEF